MLSWSALLLRLKGYINCLPNYSLVCCVNIIILALSTCEVCMHCFLFCLIYVLENAVKNHYAVEFTEGGIEFEVGFWLFCRNFDICAYRTFSSSPHTPCMKRTLCGVIVYMLWGVKWRPTYVDVYVFIRSIESEVGKSNHRMWYKSWNTKCTNKYSLWHY